VGDGLVACVVGVAGELARVERCWRHCQHRSCSWSCALPSIRSVLLCTAVVDGRNHGLPCGKDVRATGTPQLDQLDLRNFDV
jgi:hypothetical protein